MGEAGRFYRIRGVRYGIPYEDPLDDGHRTLEEAIVFSFWEYEDNHSSPNQILCPDGRVIGREELEVLWDEYRDKNNL